MTGTAIIEAQSTLPANINEMFKQDVEALQGRLLAPSGDKIKIDNKKFILPGGTKLDYLDAVIVDFVYANRLHLKPYQKGVITPPDCFATNPESTALAPSPKSPSIQSKSCTGCEQNQFGTAVQGGGKACQNRVLIALLFSDAKVDTPFVILDISPTATKGFSAYVDSVKNALGRPPYGVFTKIVCNPEKKEDVATFSEPQKIDDAAFIMMVRGRQGEARTRLMTDPNVEAFTPANESKLQPARRRRA